jgi:hypothetical protein
MDIALTIRESCGSSLYSDFLLDVSALRGNRWIRNGAGARVRKKVEPES